MTSDWNWRAVTRSYKRTKWGLVLALLITIQIGSCYGQTLQSPDITKVPTLYVVPYAHLDTQWRWEYPQVISEYLLKTMRVNFDYMGKYPHYVFNWTGANRYRLMKEYYPDDYAKIKQYVGRGQWFPAGSSEEEGDVNLPGAEGIIRQVLYGNTYFRHEFGKASTEYMLPDCFGFPASLPSILAHSGIKGFSTQKLNAAWQPAPKVGGPGSIEDTPEGIPFNVGRWIGPDGKSILAALNPGGYTGTAYTDLSKEPPPTPPALQLTDEEKARLSPQQLTLMQRSRPMEQDWVKRINMDGQITGVYADYHYVGTGDIGGAPPESTVKLLEAMVTQSETVLPPPPQFGFRGAQAAQPAPSGPPVKVGDGPLHVMISAADQMFNAITPDLQSGMPEYKGDLELINHSAGSLTSQAFHKRLIIKNEFLADAAEKASIAAQWMGGRPYPQERLNNAWTLELAGHFHDAAAGTATPRSYQYLWNDDFIAANQFADVLTSATAAIASGLDTRGRGIPVVLYNPLNISREDLVEASVNFPDGAPKAVRVYGPDGEATPSQLEGGKVVFVGKAPSVGYAVYDIVPATAPATSTLKVTDHSLENVRYRVQINANGDVSSIFDKSLNKELLSAPMRLAITNDAPTVYPAWNMDYDQVEGAPRAYVGGPAQIRIKENGPARVAIEVTRETDHSRFVETVSLAAGEAGDHVEFANAIDWRTLSANLKQTIPLTASNAEATYNWEIGTIQRPNAQERQFEVASHRWIDLTDSSGSFGITILTDCKNGSDKPNDNTIRLTLLRSPGTLPDANGRPSPYSDQANQDWGHHQFVFGLAGHAGDWRSAQTDWQGYRLSDPLIAFESAKHGGSLGKSFSLLHLNNSRIRVMALKKAEDSNEVVLRMVELDGKSQPDVHVTFAGPVAAAREVNGQEQPVGSAQVSGGDLETSFSAYQPRTFALKLGAPNSHLAAPQSEAVTLNYDLSVASNDDTKTAGVGMDGNGDALPAEMLPQEIDFNGVHFRLATAATGVEDAVVAKGQTIMLPPKPFNRVVVLAASADQDQVAQFKADRKIVELNVQAWNGFIGQWDTRIWAPGTGDNRDWASSAHHQPWPPSDLQASESHPPSPRYPEDYVGLRAGFVKPATLAWFASHHHTADGLNEPYQYSYLFAYSIDVPEGTRALTLPNNDRIRILAISVDQDNPSLKPVVPLYDKLNQTESSQQMEQAEF